MPLSGHGGSHREFLVLNNSVLAVFACLAQVGPPLNVAMVMCMHDEVVLICFAAREEGIVICLTVKLACISWLEWCRGRSYVYAAQRAYLGGEDGNLMQSACVWGLERHVPAGGWAISCHVQRCRRAVQTGGQRASAAQWRARAPRGVLPV